MGKKAGERKEGERKDGMDRGNACIERAEGESDHEQLRSEGRWGREKRIPDFSTTILG